MGYFEHEMWVSEESYYLHAAIITSGKSENSVQGKCLL